MEIEIKNALTLIPIGTCMNTACEEKETALSRFVPNASYRWYVNEHVKTTTHFWVCPYQSGLKTGPKFD